MTFNSSSTQQVCLKFKDNVQINVNVWTIMQAKTIKDFLKMIESDNDNNDEIIEIPLTNQEMRQPILNKIIEFCKEYKNDIPEDILEQEDERLGLDEEKKEKPLSELDNPEDYSYLNDFDKEFIEKCADGEDEVINEEDKIEIMKEILLGANFLGIPNLVMVCCKYFANSIRGKPAEEIREFLGIEEQFTKEEQEQLKQEEMWMKGVSE